MLIEASGYRSITLKSVDQNVKITLVRNNFLFDTKDEVLLPALTTTKGKVVNNVTSLNLKEITSFDNVRNLEDILTGRVAGLFEGTNLRRFGDALIIVDGLPRPANSVRIEEIDKISVLKDLNSAILYGTQATNGIVLVKTKRGEINKRKMNLYVEQRLDVPVSLPKYLSSAEYMALYNEARKNDGLFPQYTDQEIENFRTGNSYRYPNVDYYGSNFLGSYREVTDASVEFSGGNKVAQYYTNVGWIRKGSLYKMGEGANSQENRLNVRGNVDFVLSKDIKSHIDLSTTINMNKLPNVDFWNYAQTYLPNYYSPLLPVNLITNKDLIQSAKTIDGGYILGGTSQYQNNVIGDFFLGGYRQNIQRNAHFNGGVDFSLGDLLKGLELKTNLRFDFYNAYTQAVQNKYAVYQPVWNENDSITSLAKIGEDASDGVQNLTGGAMYRNVNFNISLEYQNVFNEIHSVSGFLTSYYNNLTTSNVRMSDKYAHVGLKISYDYRNKYIADFSAALTNSIKLPTTNNVALSPTFGLGWVISNEDFWSDDLLFDYLKLKVYGGTLNTDVNFGYNLYKDAFSQSTDYAWGDASGYSGSSTYVSRTANPNLNYEKIKNINIGFETYLFDKSLFVGSEIFHIGYSDKVIRRTNFYTAYLSGFVPYENFEEDSYTGIELTVNYKKKFGDLFLNLGANMSYVQSKVIKKDEIWNEDYLYRAGKPTDALYGLTALGLFKNQEQITSSPSQLYGTVLPGDIMYLNLNSDNQIDDNDQTFIGNSKPRYVYGTTINLSYKAFSLFILGEGAAKYNKFYENSYFWIEGNDKYSEIVLGRWTPETAETAVYPRLSSLANNNNYRRSTYWMYDASYFSISRMQFSYNLTPADWRIPFVNTAKIYGRAENLLMLCYKPELRQMNVGSEPRYKSFVLGLNLVF